MNDIRFDVVIHDHKAGLRRMKVVKHLDPSQTRQLLRVDATLRRSHQPPRQRRHARRASQELGAQEIRHEACGMIRPPSNEPSRAIIFVVASTTGTVAAVAMVHSTGIVGWWCAAVLCLPPRSRRRRRGRWQSVAGCSCVVRSRGCARCWKMPLHAVGHDPCEGEQSRCRHRPATLLRSPRPPSPLLLLVVRCC